MLYNMFSAGHDPMGRRDKERGDFLYSFQEREDGQT